MKIPSDRQVQQACKKALKPIPAPEAWMFFSYGDAPAAIGGGIGAFHWFKTQRMMLDFIADWLPFEMPGPSSSDPEKVVAGVKKAVDETKDATTLETVRKQLNKALRGYSQIGWWGTFEELCSSAKKYPSKLRGEFLESGGKAPPLPPAKRKAFAAFLTKYGV